MEEKAKVVIELDKKTVQTAAYLADKELSDEVWQEMVAEPILFPTELMEEQRKEMELGMAMAAIALTIGKMKDKQ